MNKLKLQTIVDLLRPDNHKLDDNAKYEVASAFYQYMIDETKRLAGGLLPTKEELEEEQREMACCCYGDTN